MLFYSNTNLINCFNQIIRKIKIGILALDTDKYQRKNISAYYSFTFFFLSKTLLLIERQKSLEFFFQSLMYEKTFRSCYKRFIQSK